MPSVSSSSSPTLLSIPPELRLRIYTHLFTHRTILVNPSLPSAQQNPFETDSDASWTMTAVPLSSQFLRVNRQLHAESSPLLYNTNTFDVSCREGTKLLLKTIGTTNFSLITHLLMDWDGLQDFSFMLARPDFVAVTAGLVSIDLKAWRMRVTGGTSFLWRDVRSAERSICEAALAITQKTRRLRVVAQRSWVRPQRHTAAIFANSGSSDARRNSLGTPTDDLKASRAASVEGQASMTMRIKWRFLTGEEMMRSEETRVDLEAELKVLNQGTSAKDEGSVQMALDPI